MARASNLDNFLLHDREHPHGQTVYLAGNVKVGEKGAGGGGAGRGGGGGGGQGDRALGGPISCPAEKASG